MNNAQNITNKIINFQNIDHNNKHQCNPRILVTHEPYNPRMLIVMVDLEPYNQETHEPYNPLCRNSEI